MFDVEYDKTKIKSNFSSLSTIKDIKQNLTKQMVEKTKDNYIIKLYINGKEANDDYCLLGNLIEGDRGDLVMACVTLPDEIANNEKKLYENLIKHLSRTCGIHINNKAMNVCMSCSVSICDLCIQDHQNHKIISKKEIINYEENLIQISNFLDEKFLEIGLMNNKENMNYFNYQDFYKNIRQDLSRQCDNLFKLIEEIKKKELHLINSFKLELESSFPSILDYRDKIKDLIFQLTENKKQRILRNDSDFIDFYLKYSQITNTSEKSKQNLLEIKNVTDKYKDIIYDFKIRTEFFLKIINENIEKIRGYDLHYGNPINKVNVMNTSNNMLLNNSNNIREFNSVNKNENVNYLNLKYFDSSNNLNNNIINNLEANNKQQHDQNLKDYNNSFVLSSQNSGKINLINLLGSTGKNKNNLIKSLNKFSNNQKGPNLLELSLRNNQHLNKSNKSFPDLAVEDDSPLKLLNDGQEKEIFLQNKIFSVQISSKNIFIFDNSTNLITKQEVDFTDCQMTKFESHQNTINYKNKFFISGGGGFYSAQKFYELDQENLKLKKLNDMLYKHQYHTLIGAMNNIFAISGFNSKKCEKYEIKNEKWVELPDLNEPRSYPSCICLENKIIYLFGGFLENLGKSNLQVEKFNIQAPLNWEKIELNASNGNIQEIPFYSGIIQCSTDKIYLLGGKMSKESLSINNIYNINLKENTIEENTELQIPQIDEFQGKLFLKFNAKKFAQFSSFNQNKLYIFDEETNSFEVNEFKS